jgi:hypothetical protein
MRGGAIVAVLSMLISGAVGGSAVAAGPTSPTDTQQQVSAQRPIPVPPTPSCTETLMVHDFANSYGAPYNGSYTPPAQCPGPWAKVVLTLTSTVDGVQFDRDVYVAVGHAVLLDGTTSEPCCTGNASTWTVTRDVIHLSSLLAAPQPVQVELDNVNDDTYTGVYHTIVSLTFYEPDATHPAATTPETVLPVSSDGGGGPMLTIGKDGQQTGTSVTFPQDMTRLTAEVFADAHGPCEEFWWADPGDCPGTPYREVAVYLDGRLAGAAPAYPVIYTGAGGPGLWEPIPSSRAWDIRPYDLDLTPFVATLTDGAPHSVMLGVLSSSLGAGDFWAVAANMLVTRDPRGARTRGGLLSASASAQPTQTVTDPTGQAVPYVDEASHELTFGGVTINGNRRVTTTVHESMGETARQAILVDAATWTWDTSMQTVADGHTTVTQAHADYGITSDLLTTYDLVDDGTTSTTVDGVRTAWSATTDHMRTADTTGIVFNGVEEEDYGFADAGTCYHHVLASQAGEVTVDNVDATLCPAADG